MFRILPISLLAITACSLSFAAVDAPLLALAPAQSQVVAAVNVDGSRNSAFGQFLLRQLSIHDDSFQQMIEQTGFDPRRDLQSVLITAAPSQDSAAQGRFAVIARGNFDANRIKAAAQKKGCTLQHYQGVELLVGNDSHQQTAVAFPDVDLAVMGDIASIKQVIGNRANPASLDSSLQEQIVGVEGNDAWFASVMPPTALAAGLDSDVKKSVDPSRVLQAIVRSSGGISFGDASRIAFNAITRSAQDAVALADVVRFLASMAQTQRGNGGGAASFASALDSMKLNVDGSSVQVSLQVPESTLEQLAHPPAKLGEKFPGRTTR